MDRPYLRGKGDVGRFEPRDTRVVGVRELSRDTSKLLEEVRNYGRLIVCRHGEPVAVILSVEDGLDWVLGRMEGPLADRIHQDLLKGRYLQVWKARRELATHLLGDRLAAVGSAHLVDDGERMRW